MARHFAHFYLEGGQEVEAELSKLEVKISDDTGAIVSYELETCPSENISYLYFRPNAIVGIKAILLEADEEEPVTDEKV